MGTRRLLSSGQAAKLLGLTKWLDIVVEAESKEAAEAIGQEVAEHDMTVKVDWQYVDEESEGEV